VVSKVVGEEGDSFKEGLMISVGAAEGLLNRAVFPP
jgi:hypothetical protein